MYFPDDPIYFGRLFLDRVYSDFSLKTNINLLWLLLISLLELVL